jgi:hypothetical protein
LSIYDIYLNFLAWFFKTLSMHPWLLKHDYCFNFKFCYNFWPLACILVATLALGLWPTQELAKVRAKSEFGSHISCSWECKRMWGNEPPHSQMNSHFKNWSLNGLLNLQRMIAKVKSHWIEKLLIPLEISWNVDA